MPSFRPLLPVLCVLTVLAAPAGRASAQTPTGGERTVRISDVEFGGRLVFPEEQLRLNVRTRANRHLLGIPGATWWLWLYRLGDSIGGSIGRGIRSSGEPPAILDQRVVDADVERLRLFYVQEGFRSAFVAARIDSTERGDRARVRFVVEPGAPTWIRDLSFRGVQALSEEHRERLVEGSLVALASVPDSVRTTTRRAVGQRYSEPLLLEEGRRILEFLRRAGYASVTRDSIHAVIVPARPDSFDVILDIQPGMRYRFGNVAYSVTGIEASPDPRADTVRTAAPSDSIPGGRVTALFTRERRMSTGLLMRTLQFRPGEWYDQERLDATKRRLDATGVFAFTDFQADLADTTRVRRGGDLRIPLSFRLQTRPRHQIRLQTFTLQRSGALADSDNEIGMGLGTTYSNLNTFGEGEQFRLQSTGTVAADLGGPGGFTSAQWEVSASLTYPYLTFPFARLERWLGLYDARTQLSVSLLAARRDALRLVLRGRGGARYRLEMRHNPTLTSLVDLLDLTVSSPDTLSGFSEIFLDDVLAAIDDPIQRGQIVEDYTEPQINNALRYTLRSARVDPFRRSEGYSYEGSVELGGNLPYLLDRYVLTPGDVEGSLPGLPFFRGRGSSGRLLYRQYVRLVGDFRRYIQLDPGSVLAWKAFVGVAHPTGEADVIPFDRRFYSGGANSVRAWRLRQLGPGSASFVPDVDSVTTGTTNLLGGEIKLEASIEFRRTVIRKLLAADWILAVFADAGNVWSGPRNPGIEGGRFRFDTFYREIGVGSGFGVRLAWEYLIVRLDFAYKVHDPLRRSVFLPDGFNDPVVQFGIGHTF
jgi:outer membrane translocation and assembly module TamA